MLRPGNNKSVSGTCLGAVPFPKVPSVAHDNIFHRPYHQKYGAVPNPLLIFISILYASYLNTYLIGNFNTGVPFSKAEANLSIIPLRVKL